MSWISRTFLKGLMAVLPIAVTAAVLFWLGSAAESLLGGLLRAVLPEGVYRPGLGLAAGLLLIFLSGTLLNVWVLEALFEKGDRLLAHVPLVKTLYTGTRDLLGYFSRPGRRPIEQAVLVRLGEGGGRLIGLVTRDSFADLPAEVGGGDRVAVYCPFIYAVGGVTLLVPRDGIERVPLSVEEAMRFAITAGMSIKREGDAGAPSAPYATA